MTVIDPRTGFVRAMVGGKDADYWHDADAGRVNLATGQGRPRAPDRLRLQALRPRDRARERHQPFDRVPGPRLDRHPARGWPHLARHERRGQRVRHDEPAERHGELGEHRLRPADRAARCRDRSWRRRNGWACGAACGSASPATPLSPYLSAVLGTNESNTLEMASAYGTLATGGRHSEPGAGGQRHRRTGRDALAGAPRPEAGARTAGRRGGHRHPAGRGELRHRAARRSSGDRSSARPARPRRTRTRGSSVRSPSSPPRSGSGSTRA